ncbi:hypothetical protein [Citrobacter youngae]|uniref:hypothetical protein n=1 Tax=Citrobacter youngae TaxID=133448 RepID=UPI0039B4A6BD
MSTISPRSYATAFRSNYHAEKADNSGKRYIISNAIRAVSNVHHSAKVFSHLKSELKDIKNSLDTIKESNIQNTQQLNSTFESLKTVERKMNSIQNNIFGSRLANDIKYKLVDQLIQYTNNLNAIKNKNFGLLNFREVFIESPNSRQNINNLFNKMNVFMENNSQIPTDFPCSNDYGLVKDSGSIIETDNELGDIEFFINTNKALNHDQFNEFGINALAYLHDVGPHIPADDINRIKVEVSSRTNGAYAWKSLDKRWEPGEFKKYGEIFTEKLTEKLTELVESWKTTLNTNQLLVIEELCNLFKPIESIKAKNELGSMLLDVDCLEKIDPFFVELPPLLGQILMNSFAPKSQ